MVSLQFQMQMVPLRFEVKKMMQWVLGEGIENGRHQDGQDGYVGGHVNEEEGKVGGESEI